MKLSMFFYEGLQCPVCNRDLLPDEDIVACPQCGLPHHRQCWHREGHCHLEAFHGTEHQWTREEAIAAVKQDIPASAESTMPPKAGTVCPRCSATNPEYAEFCQRCGYEMSPKEWHSQSQPWYAQKPHEFTPFTFTQKEDDDGGDIIDDVPARDVAAVVNAKQDYYIPRFRRMSRAGAGGWNWAAFVFGAYWFLYRRMYLGGALLLLLNAVYSILGTIAFLRLGISVPFTQTIDISALDETQKYCLLSIFVLTGIMLLIRILIAALANRLYKQHCVSVIKKSKERVPDISASELSQMGGVSYSVPAIGYMIYYVLIQVISLLLL